MTKRAYDGTVPARRFDGDWPKDRVIEYRHVESRPGGVGPAHTDVACGSCDQLISTTAECRCSA